jgi:hypothetical protein
MRSMIALKVISFGVRLLPYEYRHCVFISNCCKTGHIENVRWEK